MISTADFRNGMVVELDNDLMEIVEFQHVKPGKGGAFVRTKFKNVLTGRVLEKTFRSGEKFEEARIETRKWQFLYSDGEQFHFMDHETYEQLAVDADVVGDQALWIKENSDASLIFYKGNVISVEAPAHVVLEITKSDPGVQGDRSSGAKKPATLETGATIQVPLFLNEGDHVKVDTRTGEYLERM
ncbi:MAG TPA: elongation factor P [Candidatus Hydrogenedentes bacterium]|jgi:elongation factor P|nr:elongation factor P [Candidatus Hydrogenedentota bacterium]HOD96207.1 elongation factor P [Candidatus Hydrogenedentota bacterium]HOH42240.1 elongation factor P [Candidatus Hydrogenedentota bacterium]HOM47301.1 elongation factor P [Candidatus Hydrogenedentota bacterium]HOR51600.1 elongation factor P [Candidatus Hydrogenedentota bacterium]